MDNVDLARVLGEIADLLEIESGNPFRVRAYRTAARTIEALGEPASAIAARDPAALAELPGIGKDLAGKIVEILTTGDLALRRELVTKVPATLVTMMRVDGVGPKRAKLLYDELGLTTLHDVEAAARDGKLTRSAGSAKSSRNASSKGAPRSALVRVDSASPRPTPMPVRWWPT